MCKTAQEILPLMRDKRSMKKDNFESQKPAESCEENEQKEGCLG